MWARRYFPEPEAGTGIVESHAQSRECRALDVMLLSPFPFQNIEKKKKKNQNDRPVKKVLHV